MAEEHEFSINDLGDFDQTPYSPFNPELDRNYPIESIVGNGVGTQIKKGDLKFLHWVSAFRSSPAKNSEAEGIIGLFTQAAYKAGQWVDCQIPADQPLGGEIDVDLGEMKVTVFHNFKLEFGKGAQILEQIGFIKLVVDEDGGRPMWMKPTEKLTEFVKTRFDELGLLPQP